MEPNRINREDFLSLVEAGIQAPSADNLHPWTFDASGNAVRVWGNDEFARAPFHRRVLSLISLGAVVENMLARARSLGLESAVSFFPNPTGHALVANLQFAASSASADELAAAIPHRHTNRRFFHGPGLTAAQRQQLETDAAAIDGARLVWLDEPRLRSRALKLIRLAEAERFRDSELHRELFAAIRFDVGWSAVTDEGLAPGSLEVERPLRPAFIALRRWPLMRRLAAIGMHHLLGIRAGDAPCRLSPHLAVVVSTLQHLEPGAVASGRLLERVWLRTTSWQMALQPLAASTLLALEQYEGVRCALRRQLARGWAEIVPGMQPLIVFRLGRSSSVHVRSGRRAVHAYLR